jgi:tetratricopeptide (TPR) repeat protein
MLRRRCVSLTVVALVLVASNSSAQVQQQGNAAAGTMQLTNVTAAARDALFAAVDAFDTWSFAEAARQAGMAVSADSSFGLARGYRLAMTGSPTAANANAEFTRAVHDASTRSAGEMTYLMATRSAGANASRLYATARGFFPNDRRLALAHANSLVGEARIDSLRALSRRVPDYVGAKIWLAYYLTLTSFSASSADRYEALNAAMDAVRVAPRTAGTHTALGHALTALGREDEAVAHLNAATKMDPGQEYAYVVLSEIYADDGKPRRVDRARAALDSAIAVNASYGRRNNQRINRGLLLFYDGRSAEGFAELEAIAKEIEGNGGNPAVLYAQMAGLAAGIGDSAGCTRWMAEAKRVQGPANISIQSAQAYALNHQGPEARRAIEDYLRTADTTTLAFRYDLSRMTGMALLAEGKPAEALAELKKSDTQANTFAQLAMVDAYAALKDQKSADETLAALVARRDVGNAAVSKALANYRMAKKRR